MGRYRIGTGILLSALIAILLMGCSPATGTSSLKVVTSTSLLETIVERVGGDCVEVINLIPPSQHPGDFDIKPADVQKLAGASVFLLHGWPGEGYADKLIASADNPALKVIKVEVQGNWMIPSVQIAATDKVADVLVQIDSKNAAAYKNAAEDYKQVVAAKEAEIKARLATANISGVNVIASVRQADFLQWLGFNIVASYTPESLTPQVVQGLVDKGRAANVTLIVDNLQDGKDDGKAIVGDLNAKQVNLSNFPGGFSGTEAWEEAIDRNIDLILGAIKR